MVDSLYKRPKLCPLKQGSKKERECDYEACGFWWEGAFEIDKMCALIAIAEGISDLAWWGTPVEERNRVEQEMRISGVKDTRRK